jgi:structural maintenance of chromosome 4
MGVWIKEVSVENFKSYRGRHVLGGFDRSMTVVVGPNGSGKSNVIDAILFVLGFKAKRLRQPRAENLLCQDEEAGSARVEILFGSEEREISVGRSVSRQGKSTYSVDGRSASVEEVADLMKREGVDVASNRFMILQGEIEAIANMRPKGTPESPGLVEYIEEIIGSGRYIETIERLEREKEEMEGLLNTTESAVRFSEKEVEFLREGKEKAEGACVSRVKRGRDVIGKLEEEIGVAGEEVARCAKEKSEREAELESFLGMHKECMEKLREGESVLNREKGVLRKREAEYLEKRVLYETKDSARRRVEDERKRISSRIREVEEKMSRQREKAERQKREKTEAAEEVQENAKAVERLRQEIGEMEKRIEKESKAVKKGRVDGIMAKENELVEVLERRRGIEERVKEMQYREIEAMRAVERAEEEKTKAKEELGQIEEAKKKYDPQRHEKMVEKRREVLQSLRETEKMQEEQQKKVQSARKDSESIRNTDRLGRLLQMDGFYGRLGDLGSVDPEYEVAFAAATRGSLSSLVVDTTKTAEKALDLVRRNGLGRQTILVIDRLQRPAEFKRERLFDLVQCKEMFKPCFYHVLGETVLVRDIDEGMKLGFGSVRMRVVTLDGKVIDKSGLMSGGSVEVVRRKTDLRKEEAALQEILEGHKVIEEALRKIEGRVSEMEAYKELSGRGEERIGALQKIVSRRIEGVEREKSSGMMDELERVRSLVVEKEREVARMRKEEMGACLELEEKRAALLEQIDLLESRNTRMLSLLKERDFSVECGELPQLEREMRELDKEGEVDAREEKEQMDSAQRALKDQQIILCSVEESYSEVKMQMEQLHAREIAKRREVEYAGGRLQGKEKEITEKKTEYSRVAGEVEQMEEQAAALGVDLGADAPHVDLGEVDFGAIRGYNEKMGVLRRERERMEERKKAKEEGEEEIGRMREQRRAEFMDGLKRINVSLKKTYSQLTFGGDAELEPVDYLDPFEEGIVMSVMPPRKSWKAISNLSGGERTLSSLSLTFALHEYCPSSFYVMDEIDAALDFKNVAVVGRFIREKENCQFIVVSLRENMYELAPVLMGVYKINNGTRTVFLRREEGIP